MNELATERLRLRPFDLGDAAFALRLLNEPGFLRHIGDKGVRTLEDARAYLADGPLASYARHGFGLLAVVPRAGGEPLGMCGLLKRDVLPDPDVGFALLAAHEGRGYAFEAASAVLADARERLGLARIVALVAPDNARSIRLLERLGMFPEGAVRLAEGDAPCRLFALGPPGGPPPPLPAG